MRRWWALSVMIMGCASDGRRGSDEVSLRVGTSEVITEPSPFSKSGLGPIAQDLVYRSLIRADPSGKKSGDLAESWSFGEDQTRLRIKLRPGLRFSDGSAVTTADVVETYRRAKAEAMWGMNEIVSLRAVDDETLEIVPARPGVVPAGLIVGVVRVAATGVTGALGPGPYFVAARSEEHLTLRANPRYLGRAPGCKTIEFRYFANASDEWSQLLAHNVDLITLVPWAKQEFLETIPSIREVSSLSSAVAVINFVRPTPPFDLPEVRYALSLSIDRGALIRLAERGHGRPAEGVVWPLSDAYDRSLQPYPYDPRQARRILLARGLVALADGSWTWRGTPLRLSLSYLKGATELEEVALQLQEQLAEFGVRVELEALTLAEAVRSFSEAPSLTLLHLRHATSDPAADADAADLVASAAGPSRTPAADPGSLQLRMRDEPRSIYLFWPERLDIIDNRFCGLPRLPDGPESELELVHPCAPGESN